VSSNLTPSATSYSNKLIYNKNISIGSLVPTNLPAHDASLDNRAKRGRVMRNRDAVFDQAESLWRPQSARLRNAYENSVWPALSAKFAKGGLFGTAFMHAVGDLVDGELAARGIAIVTALRDAHATVGSVRTNKWSKETFTDWAGTAVSQEADALRALWSSAPNTQWADTRHTYLHAVAVSEERERNRVTSLVVQHFGTATKSRIAHWLSNLEPLKSVPTAWWTAAVSMLLFALAILSPTFAEKIRALFGIH
jgi:hypothetical protein